MNPQDIVVKKNGKVNVAATKKNVMQYIRDKSNKYYIDKTVFNKVKTINKSNVETQANKVIEDVDKYISNYKNNKRAFINDVFLSRNISTNKIFWKLKTVNQLNNIAKQKHVDFQAYKNKYVKNIVNVLENIDIDRNDVKGLLNKIKNTKSGQVITTTYNKIYDLINNNKSLKTSVDRSLKSLSNVKTDKNWETHFSKSTLTHEITTYLGRNVAPIINTHDSTIFIKYYTNKKHPGYYFEEMNEDGHKCNSSDDCANNISIFQEAGIRDSLMEVSNSIVTLKSATPLTHISKSEYNEYQGFKYVNVQTSKNSDGMCLPNLLVNHLNQQIENDGLKYNVEQIDGILKELCLTHGCKCIVNEDLKRIHCVNHLKLFCETYNISLYIVDIYNTVLEKYIYSNNLGITSNENFIKFRAIYALVFDQHINIINNEHIKRKIKQKAGFNKGTSTIQVKNFKSLHDEKQQQTMNECSHYFDISYDDVVNDIEKYTNSIVYATETDLTNFILQYYTKYNIDLTEDQFLNIIECVNNKVQHYKCDKYNIQLHTIPLKSSFTHKELKYICDCFHIEYKCQTLCMISKQIYNKFNNVEFNSDNKTQRETISKAIKLELLKEQKNKCNTCDANITNYYECDHIVEIARGGANEKTNLQLLCKQCHDSKTARFVQEYVIFKNDKPLLSHYNSDTNKIFNLKKNGYLFRSKHHQLDIFDNENVSKEINHVYGVDFKKMRRNCLLNNNYNFPKFTSLDEVTTFEPEDSILDHAVYYVKAKLHHDSELQYFPFTGETTWVTGALLKSINNLNSKYSKNENTKHLCVGYQILYKIVASTIINKNHFNPFINYILTTLSSSKSNNLDSNRIEFVGKQMINMFVGSLGSKNIKHTNAYNSLVICQTKEEMIYNVNQNDHIPVNDVKLNVGNSNKLFNFTVSSKPNHTYHPSSNSVPIFNQILDLERFEMFNMYCIFSEKYTDMKLIRLNTDQICFYTKTNPTTVKKFINDLCKTTKWNNNNLKLSIDNKADYPDLEFKNTIEESYYTPRINNPYVITYDDESDFVKSNNFARSLLQNNKSFQINGRAGTGKTTLIKSIVKLIEDNKQKYVILSPTNDAATNYPNNSKTLHSFFIKYIDELRYLKNMYDYIIVDEISMINESILRYLYELKNISTNTRFILAGDFSQLPPVNDTNEYDYKNSSIIYDLSDGNKVLITKNRRSDSTIFDDCQNILNNVEIDTNKYKLPDEKYNKCLKHLCFTNSLRKSINQSINIDVFKRLKCKKIVCKSNPNNNKSQEFLLYKNLPLVAIINDKHKKICKGRNYKITNINEGKQGCSVEIVDILNKDITLTISTEKLTKLFTIAYASTIHSSQGKTYTQDYVIHEWSKLNNTLRYVALSRTSNSKIVHINL